ncbi:hypothetical protein DFH08DRAFT_840934 [Mycena albidolilacea]|uniref:DUF6533 domain-containing protein n=1 Tax=Mycena albidolilacea TaxID=1033008 RepID=A0AAD7ALP7_9AGAR|nr:hypothetical protein DFH08DRAFT_840934 [Mycena albidolilacea]
MSNFSATSGDSDFQTIYLQNYCHLFPVCFLIYDQIITLGKEIDLVWRRPRAPSAYWFLALRYGALMINLPIGVFSFVSLPSPKVCFNSAVVHQVFMLATELAVSVVMIIRVYALYGRSARILWWLIGIAASLTGLTVWGVGVGQHGHPLTVLSGCHFYIVRSASYHLAIAWECLFAFDSIIFGLTVYNAYLTRRAVGPDQAMPIHRLMVRDGAIYFAAMAFANLTNIATFFINGRLLPGSLATFATCMSVAMVTHLLLDLYECQYGAMVPNLSEVQGELELPVDPV